MGRGQVTIETIMSIAVVLGLLAIIAVNSMQKTSVKESVEAMLEQVAECRTLAAAITEAYAQGTNSATELSLGHDANIAGNTVLFENASCIALGSVQGAELTAGTVIVKNLDGTVVVENA